MELLAHFPRLVIEDQNVCLNVVIMKEELLHAIKCMHPDNIPRPDGCPTEFCLGMFDTIGDDLPIIIEGFRIKGIILVAFNTTF